MKNLCFATLFLFYGLVLSAQHGATLYSNDRAFTRENPMPLRPGWAPFFHGVASGDPLADRVIIWTRVTPPAMDNRSIEVDWRVATDTAFANVVRSGTVTTDPTCDYTVKVDVTGLQAGTTYYYGFTALGANSLTGRTQTTPAGNGVSHLKFGVVSCSNFQDGYFNAYQRLSERNDLDAIIHLGDYIYEQGSGQYGELEEERPIAPKTEILTLEDYRMRYSTYRLDTSLIRAHQQHPFITVWDDHESANDAYQGGAKNHDPDTEGDWETRKAIAKQVYFEWMPIRGMEDDQRVFRKISYGTLLDLIMLDTRLEGREKQILDPFDPLLQDTGRTLLGAAQKAWLLDQLSGSQARWKILGQQVVFAPFEVGWSAAFDQDPDTDYALAQGLAQDIWNGYPAERRQIIDFIREQEIDNVVILTGDFHTTFAFDVTGQPVDIHFEEIDGIGRTPIYSPNDNYDPATGEGSVAVEFATPSISSANFDENFSPLLAFFLQQLINKPVTLFNGLSIGNPNPHLKYPDLTNHGYFILDVKPDSVQANWYFGEVRQVVNTETFSQAWYTRNGEGFLRRASAPSPPKEVQDTPAPPDPPASMTTAVDDLQRRKNFVVLGVYPNPFHHTNTLHYALHESAGVQIDLYNTEGKLIRSLLDRDLPPGLYHLQLDAGSLPRGTYFYRIRANGQMYSTKVVLQE